MPKSNGEIWESCCILFSFKDVYGSFLDASGTYWKSFVSYRHQNINVKDWWGQIEEQECERLMRPNWRTTMWETDDARSKDKNVRGWLGRKQWYTKPPDKQSGPYIVLWLPALEIEPKQAAISTYALTTGPPCPMREGEEVSMYEWQIMLGVMKWDLWDEMSVLELHILSYHTY